MRHLHVTWLVMAVSLWGGGASIGTISWSTGPAALQLHEADTIGSGVEGRQVVLKTGAVVWLDPLSRAEFHADRMVLEQGGARAVLAGGYRIEAGQLTILPRGQSTALVGVLGNGNIAVSAEHGALTVQSCGSTLVKNVLPPQILEFAMQTPESGPIPKAQPPRSGVAGACKCTEQPKTPAGKTCRMCAYGELSVVNGKLMIDDPLRGQIELEDRFDKGVIPGYGKKYAQLLADVKAAQAAGKPMRCQFCTTVTTDAVNNAGMVASIGSAQCGLPPPSKDELLGELPKISNMRYDATKCTWYWETCSKYTYTLKPGVVYPSGLDVMPKERNPFKNEEPDPPQILGSYSGTPPDVTLTPLTCFWTGGKGAVPGEKQLTMRDSLTGKKFALTGSNQQLLKQIQDGAKNQDHMRICGLLNKDGSLSVMAVKKYGGPNAIPKGNGMSVASPCLIVGKLSKDDEGNYYITDPTTGAMFQVKPSDDEKKKMDKWLVKPDCKDAPYSLNLCEDKQIPVKPSVGGNPPVIDLTQQVGALPANPVGVAGATGPEGPVGTVASGGGVSTKTVVIVTTSLAAVGLITGIVVNEESGGKQPASPE